MRHKNDMCKSRRQQICQICFQNGHTGQWSLVSSFATELGTDVAHSVVCSLWHWCTKKASSHPQLSTALACWRPTSTISTFPCIFRSFSAVTFIIRCTSALLCTSLESLSIAIHSLKVWQSQTGRHMQRHTQWHGQNRSCPQARATEN